jgi:hypothetical protein
MEVVSIIKTSQSERARVLARERWPSVEETSIVDFIRKQNGGRGEYQSHQSGWEMIGIRGPGFRNKREEERKNEGGKEGRAMR